MYSPRTYEPAAIHRRRTGFTLLELIVVITIIGILSTIVVMNTAGVGAKGRLAKIKTDAQHILTVAKTMNTQTGRWPETIEEMVNAKDEQGKDLMVTLESTPKDPWGNDYQFMVADGRPRVVCLGSDNAEGGDGSEAEDVTFPEQQAQ